MKKFCLTLTDNEGGLKEHLGNALTPAGVAMLCPPFVPMENIVHMCMLAAENPNYPYDLTAWADGGDGYRFLKWSARLMYQEV